MDFETRFENTSNFSFRFFLFCFSVTTILPYDSTKIFQHTTSHHLIFPRDRHTSMYNIQFAIGHFSLSIAISSDRFWFRLWNEGAKWRFSDLNDFVGFAMRCVSGSSPIKFWINSLIKWCTKSHAQRYWTKRDAVRLNRMEIFQKLNIRSIWMLINYSFGQPLDLEPNFMKKCLQIELNEINLKSALLLSLIKWQSNSQNYPNRMILLNFLYVWQSHKRNILHLVPYSTIWIWMTRTIFCFCWFHPFFIFPDCQPIGMWTVIHAVK